MLSLVLVVAIISFYLVKKKKNKFSKKFYYFLFLGGCAFSFFYASMISYIYFYNSVGTDISYYEKDIQQLELELDELDTLIIKTTSSNSALTDKEIDIVLDGLVEKKKELEEQIDSNNAKINNLLHYHNPKILKMAKFLIYFG